jgi:hypothetical protein
MWQYHANNVWTQGLVSPDVVTVKSPSKDNWQVMQMFLSILDLSLGERNVPLLNAVSLQVINN